MELISSSCEDFYEPLYANTLSYFKWCYSELLIIRFCLLKDVSDSTYKQTCLNDSEI